MNLKKKSRIGLLIVMSSIFVGGSVVKAGEQVPIKGKETGVQFPIAFDFPFLTIGFTSGGEASHVGKYTTSGSVVIDVRTGEAFDAHATLTAADGDKIFVDLEAMPLSPTMSLIEGTITGGTGKFDGATGSYLFLLETEFPSDVLPNPFTGIWSGTISRNND